MSSTKDTSTFVLKSSLQLSDFVELLLEPLYKYQHLYLIRLGLHEALVNAVKHGNKFDSSKIIKVKRIITPHWCVWIIQDQGQGMKQDKRKFILPKRIDAVSGRGLFIIKECFDDVRWSPKGNKLQLSLRR